MLKHFVKIKLHTKMAFLSRSELPKLISFTPFINKIVFKNLENALKFFIRGQSS